MDSSVNTAVVDFALIIGADLLTNILYGQLCEFAFSPVDVVQKTSFRVAAEFLQHGMKIKLVPNLILIDLDGLMDEYDAIWRWHNTARQSYGKNLCVVYLYCGNSDFLFPKHSLSLSKPVTVKSLRLSVLKKLSYC